MNVVLFDSERKDYLQFILQNKGIALVQNIGEQPTNTIVLLHKSENTTNKTDTLMSVANAGGIGVIYSGSPVDEKEEPTGNGSILTLRWTTVDEIISHLPNSFKLDDFRTAIESIRKRHLLNGLAILSLCTSIPSDQESIVNFQSKWKSSRDKWFNVFSECTRDDLIIACGGSAGKPLPVDMSEVSKLIDWILPLQNGEIRTPAQPDVAEVLTQIKQKFGISL